MKQKEEGVTQRLGIFTIDLGNDTTTLPWGNESIYRNREFAGYITSAGFGHTLGKAVCMGYICGGGTSGVVMKENASRKSTVVTRRYLKEGQYEIEIDGKLWPATLHLTPPCDPKLSSAKV